MTLQDLFNQLAIGELAQISVSNNGSISVEDQKKILPHVNLGILELHKRFTLREQETVVIKNLDRTTTVAIDDPAFLKVDKVFGPDPKSPCEKEYLIDAEGNPDSVYTPSWNSVLIPKGLPTGKYRIVFRAKHDAIDESWLESIGADKLALPVPPTHVYALELFIASQLLTPMGFDGEMHEGNNYAMKFENAVMELTNRGFRKQITVETSKFRDNGWI